MKHVEGVEAAIHCTLTLAALPQGTVMPAAALAESFGLSQSYLVKTLKTLVASGILASVPGPTGGYRAARTAEQITLKDVVLAVSGPQPAFRCQDIRRGGPCAHLPDDAFPAPCGVRTAMLAAEAAYRDALAQTTLASLLEHYADTSDPRARRDYSAFAKSALRGPAA